ncbi:hypothetical protein MAR_020660 [Mya arenaria]|uniref:DDE-1 domain-containing protein n=1 Tax=Mya arenaria TaxID=6604 RepID=A0ABY7E535_MYAAR|nr:hypothetical protein MAR_020168 [Mya arenaria]WAR04950.1 hypothetical protein MAR_020319 [Mya arenaria]WAR05291.1 hypothetical protein MAR_020660 [Mya arenaria]
MACVNSSGRRMPPIFIEYEDSSKNGWMDDDIGERWFDEVFLQFCGPERPQLLILDGHSSHETLGILMRAMEENIHILSLPPHTTHIPQPLDKTVFGPVRKIPYTKSLNGPFHLCFVWPGTMVSPLQTLKVDLKHAAYILLTQMFYQTKHLVQVNQQIRRLLWQVPQRHNIPTY